MRIGVLVLMMTKCRSCLSPDTNYAFNIITLSLHLFQKIWALLVIQILTSQILIKLLILKLGRDTNASISGLILPILKI